MLYCAKIIEETDLKRRRMKSEDRKMKEIEMTKMVEEMDLRNLTPEVDMTDLVIATPDINRPALQLTGYYEHFANERVQIIGYVEFTYLQHLEESERVRAFEEFVSRKIPCVIFTTKMIPGPEILELCNRYQVPAFAVDKSTSVFMAEIIRWLNVQLAPMISIHGVLVDVFGEGVLIMGESGIGKSEAALELIKRGHRLVSDDVVEISRVSDITLVGTAPDITRHFIELRGIGIIDVKTLFGVESVKDTQSIDLVIKLEEWDKEKEYDRLGLEEEYIEFLGNKVVCHSLPIRPGRNLAIIVETAAVNHRQKKMGYNAAQELYRRVQANLVKKERRSKKMANYVFGIDVGGTSVKCGLFQTDGTLLDKWEIPTRTENGGSEILPDIAKSVKAKMGEKGIAADDVAGVGIDVPGPVNDKGELSIAVNLNWGYKNIVKELSNELGGMAVKAANDANAAALGEMWAGGGKGSKNLVMVTLGTGVGGGIIVDGKIVAGAHGAGGEVGHACVEPEEEAVCNCGNHGCLEQMTSATGIVRLAKKYLASHDTPSSLRERGESISAKAVFDALKEGDAAAEAIVQEFSEYLGRALAVFACVVDPEVIVVGGGVSKAGQILIDGVAKYYREAAFIACKDTPIVLASLGNDAGIYGAAKMLID